MAKCVSNWLWSIRAGMVCISLLTSTHSLTPHSTVLLEKLTSLQPVNKFPTFYGTRRFITAFTSVRHLSLSWASSAGRIMSMKNSSDIIENRTRDLPVCSAVPQPTVPPAACPGFLSVRVYIATWVGGGKFGSAWKTSVWLWSGMLILSYPLHLECPGVTKCWVCCLVWWVRVCPSADATVRR
jgi:hypothetical protein